MIANRTKKKIDEGDRCFGEIGTQRLKGRANRRDIVRLTESLSITEASKYQPQFGSRNILLTTCTTGWSCFTVHRSILLNPSVRRMQEEVTGMKPASVFTLATDACPQTE
jgi:hypothetical protein